VQDFLENHKDLLKDISNSEEIGKLLDILYHAGVFSGAFEKEKGKPATQLDNTLSTFARLYDDPKLKPFLDALRKDYFEGKLPEIRKQFSTLIAPEYQDFLTDPEIMESLIHIFRKSEKVRHLLTDT